MRGSRGSGRPSPLVRRAYALGVRAVDVLSLAVFAAIIYELDWPRVVRSGLGLGDPVLLDDALILLPFLLAQVAGWWGVYAAERALRPSRGPVGLGRYLWLKARQSMGMVLPVAGLFALGSDLVHRRWPATLSSPWDQPVSLALMGVMVLVLAPAFVRLAWPTRSLPPARCATGWNTWRDRVGFRCTDILVWDTNQVVVNAGVTGSLPWFRYVLLTDALVENLSPYEVAAVFGHEIGHIAHRHLVYFGFFILGSLGVLALASTRSGRSAGSCRRRWRLSSPTWLVRATRLPATVVEGGPAAGGRRPFTSCSSSGSSRAGSSARPTSSAAGSSRAASPTARPTPTSTAGPRPGRPVDGPALPGRHPDLRQRPGERRDAQRDAPAAWSWRHGSIVRRIDFLEGLVGRPEAETRFQAGVRRMRRGVAAVLVTAVVALAAVSEWLP